MGRVTVLPVDIRGATGRVHLGVRRGEEYPSWYRVTTLVRKDYPEGCHHGLHITSL